VPLSIMLGFQPNAEDCSIVEDEETWLSHRISAAVELASLDSMKQSLFRYYIQLSLACEDAIERCKAWRNEGVDKANTLRWTLARRSGSDTPPADDARQRNHHANRDQ